MASLHSPPLYSGKRVMGLPTLPSTTVEDDPYIAPAPKLPEQLLISVQTGAGHDKDEHVYVPATRSIEVTEPHRQDGDWLTCLKGATGTYDTPPAAPVRCGLTWCRIAPMIPAFGPVR